jgi:hypothetical protein
VAQEPCRGEHHRVDPNNEDQMDKINPTTKLSNRNLPFMVKLPIGWHKVAKTLRKIGLHSTSS